VLSRFNKNKPLDKKWQEDLEDYFEYMWEHKKNWAVVNDDDLDIMNQLPNDKMNAIFKDFLYIRFLYVFRKRFIFNNFTNKI
jgi:hypothetical protein